MSSAEPKRSPAEVLDDHLRESLVGTIEDDLARNYAGDAEVQDGADSYVIRGGRIVAQTIHYTVRRLK